MATQAENNFKVSATGGAGSAGQAAQYATGIDNAQDFYDLQTSAKMSKSGPTVPQGRGGSARTMSMGEDVVPLNSPTQRPDEHPATGAALGPGAGTEALASTAMLAAQNNEDMAKLAALLPIYARIAEMPGASNATRNYYRWLRSVV